MTYNFDPERWYANEQTALDRAHHDGKIDRAAYEIECDRLQERLDAMWGRLDGSYRLPNGHDD